MSIIIVNIELLLMCALFLCLLFCFNLRYWRGNLINSLSIIYMVTIAGCFFEMAAFYADGKPRLIWLNYLSNILYLSSIGIVGVAVITYCNEQFPEPIWKTKKQHILIMLPFVFEVIFLASSPATGLILSVDKQGYYFRTSTFFLQLVPYGYLLCTTIYGLYWYFKSETSKEKNKYMAISLFSIPPFLLGGIQLLVKANSLDILEFSVTLSLLANYAVSQNNRIMRDHLTKLFNRDAMETLLLKKMKNKHKESQESLFVMVGDLDDFKKINDTYGHIEGDHALITTANVLHEVCAPYDAMVARFGGDEFVIAVECETDETPKKIVEEIDRELAKQTQKENYILKMSMGYAKYRSADTVPDILRAADRECYCIKQERKAKAN